MHIFCSETIPNYYFNSTNASKVPTKPANCSGCKELLPHQWESILELSNPLSSSQQKDTQISLGYHHRLAFHPLTKKKTLTSCSQFFPLICGCERSSFSAISASLCFNRPRRMPFLPCHVESASVRFHPPAAEVLFKFNMIPSNLRLRQGRVPPGLYCFSDDYYDDDLSQNKTKRVESWGWRDNPLSMLNC